MAKGDFISDKRVYADKDGNLVDAKDPARHTLVVAEGGSLSQDKARSYGLLKDDSAPEAVSAPADEADGEGAIDEVAESARVQASAGGAANVKRAKKGAKK